MTWLQPQKAPRLAVGYRRVMHTSPPAALPTLRLLSIGRRHSSPSTTSPHTACPHPHLVDNTGPHVCNGSTSKAISHLARPPHVVSARVPTAVSAPTKKPHLYENHRNASGSPRSARGHPSRPPGVDEPVSPSPTPATAVRRDMTSRLL
ncbi:hypothetical protein B0H19DRAFT_562452 [Mycena capillaripes]|nr:hypothetical protein B0H19DRAFT_562452 [Mycena capillaripes]